jgi:hypothetical protein
MMVSECLLYLTCSKEEQKVYYQQDLEEVNAIDIQTDHIQSLEMWIMSRTMAKFRYIAEVQQNSTG